MHSSIAATLRALGYAMQRHGWTSVGCEVANRQGHHALSILQTVGRTIYTEVSAMHCDRSDISVAISMLRDATGSCMQGCQLNESAVGYLLTRASV